MFNTGERLMMVGALFVVAAGVYWAVQSPSASQIESERFYQRLSTGYEPSTNEVRQQLQAKAKDALWPGGIGVILLGVGWAMSSGNKTGAPESATEATKNEQDGSV